MSTVTASDSQIKGFSYRIPVFVECLLNRCFVVVCCTSGCCPTIHALQHTATHCSTLQHPATHCNTLQHTAAHCSTLQHPATHCTTLQPSATHCCPTIDNCHTSPPWFNACSTCSFASGCTRSHQKENVNQKKSQHTATRRNALQHTATHMGWGGVVRA